MMRWWDNDVFIRKRSYSENEILKIKGELIQEVERKVKDETEGVRRHTFRVQAETQDSERLAVTGSCKELGSWETDALLLLDREGDSSIWSKTVALQSNSEIKYRYVIVTDDSQSEEFVKTKETEPLRSVRRWEASEDPRRIEPMGENLNVTSTKRELYLKMSADDIRRLKQSRADIERCAIEEFHNSEAAFGWLTNDIALHFKLFAKSVELFNRRLRDKPLYVKLRMIPIVPGCSTNVDYYRDGSKGWPVVEVSVLDEGRRRFRRQPEYGTPICPTMDNVIYQINAGSITGTGIVLDFHHYKKEGDIKPIHFGFSCLHPCKLGNNEGQLTTEICNIRDEIIGRVKLSYVFIFPTPTIKFKLHHSLSASWSKIWFGRDTQGRKISVVKRCVGTRNNRIYCIESTRHDVDYVRITVQFSKDSIPVFGHSPYLVVALKNPEDPFPLEQYQIRVEDMTVAQLQRMAIPPEKCSGHSDIPDHKNPLAQQNWPFPSLVQLLNGVNRNVGFLIELVTTNQLIDGSYPDRHDYDVNKYVDLLLKTTVQFAGRRKIVLSSFHPDVCSIMKLKQNRFPVLFLQDGIEGEYPAFRPDPRCHDLRRAIDFAVSLGLHGVGVNTDTVLDSDNAWRIQNDYLIAYCIHEPQDEDRLVEHFERYRLSGIIDSTHDHYGLIRKNLKYVLEPKEKELNYIRKCAEAVCNDGRLKPEVEPLVYPNSSILELEVLRLPEPTQIAADPSHRTPLKAQRRDEDEPDEPSAPLPTKSWAKIVPSLDCIPTTVKSLGKTFFE